MPGIEVSGLDQKAALWVSRNISDDHGEPTVSAGVEINVRWEKKTYEAITSDATPVAITGVIHVDRVIPEDSIMRLGTLASVPSPPDYLVQVVSYDEVPDVKGREYQRTVTVRKWKDDLPAIA
jgi:hypothetical protein